MKEQTKLIVEYQEIDKNLKAIEDGINGSEEAKKVYVARKFLSTVKDSLLELEKKAQKATESYELAVNEFEKCYNAVKEYETSVENCEDEAELDYLKKKFNDAVSKVSNAGQKIDAISNEMAELYKEYSKLAKSNKAMREQRDEYMPKFEELKNSKKEEMQALMVKLKKLESKIDASLMEKYNRMRKDKKFPIIFGLDLSKKNNNFCPSCATSMSISFMSDLELGEIKECESCHKLIYGFDGDKK